VQDMEPFFFAGFTGLAAIVGAVLVAVNAKQLNAHSRERRAARAAARGQQH